MRDYEINEAIARACGWKQTNPGWWVNPEDTNGGQAGPPDYCGDLNAMHDAENVIRPPRIATWDTWEAYCRRINDDPHATARQRAECFLRTIGGWKEEG